MKKTCYEVPIYELVLMALIEEAKKVAWNMLTLYTFKIPV